MLGADERQDFLANQRIPDDRVKIGQLKIRGAYFFARLATARDVRMDQVPAIKQRSFAGAEGGLEVAGVAGPDKQHPEANVELAKSCDPLL